MNKKLYFLILTLVLSGTCLAAGAADSKGFSLEVLVNSAPRREYRGRGRVYIEAVRGKEYTLRIHNPLPRRVAVALSVDGLNTIDARRTSAREAGKWVLGPYETITIPGWQISGQKARRFYFTGEKGSYGAMLGQTDNLGVISAVFFAERLPPPCRPTWSLFGGDKSGVRKDGELRKEKASRLPQPSPKACESPSVQGLDNDYAATGIGRKTRNPVRRIEMELETRPRAIVSIRYEFRPQLVKLGLIPRPALHPEPLCRREKATGFQEAWCPDPYKR